MPQPLQVVAAILSREGKFFVAQRPAHKTLGGKWEFPGGKIESNESPEAALLREIKEELGCNIRLLQRLPTASHHYPTFSVDLIAFLAALEQGSPEPHPHEHSDLRWVTLSELHSLDLAAADLPLLSHLQNFHP